MYVAFLVAAKSVFHWRELTRNNCKEAEYILIGTLMSFSWSIFLAWLSAQALVATQLSP